MHSPIKTSSFVLRSNLQVKREITYTVKLGPVSNEFAMEFLSELMRSLDFSRLDGETADVEQALLKGVKRIAKSYGMYGKIIGGTHIEIISESNSGDDPEFWEERLRSHQMNGTPVEVIYNSIRLGRKLSEPWTHWGKVIKITPRGFTLRTARGYRTFSYASVESISWYPFEKYHEEGTQDKVIRFKFARADGYRRGTMVGAVGSYMGQGRYSYMDRVFAAQFSDELVDDRPREMRPLIVRAES